MKRVMPFAAMTVSLAALAVGCMSASPAAQKVRITGNPDVVRGCQFLGNVKATSGFVGGAGTGIGSNNTEVALREKTAKLGGNVVFIVTSGVKATGESYACPVPTEVPETDTRAEQSIPKSTARFDPATRKRPQLVRSSADAWKVLVTDQREQLVGCKSLFFTRREHRIVNPQDMDVIRAEAAESGGNVVWIAAAGRPVRGEVFQCPVPPE